ncbi:hypothetical protein BASA50_009412 [Batrachochytrium salamandrivorans]|uniref:Tail specific protease domain-containing protein n=1 Tax=Batrachochytrium salamandrivorans TaxID=1357716 RepID=A0ABQ8F4P2_9FUNG|nr:hypothetical protein BASA50_009412 [Batrachochytrium salamandrivorans]
MDLTNHQMWVNFDSKQSHYNGKANPYPDLDTFRKTYVGMTDEQFSLGLTKIFNRMRDLHTLYYKAGPYGCFSLSTGLFFKFVDDSLRSSEPPKVRVVGMTDTPEVLDLIGNVLSAVAVGDELLTINGLSFHDWYDQNKFILGFGANDSGGHRGAFQYLEGVSGSSNILPEVDGITFQLRRLGGNQELYTVTVPYVALYNDECWSLSSNLYKELTGIALHRTPAPTSLRQKRELLVNQLKDTDSILFDVRGNTGGLISAADGIIQLFKPDVTASQFVISRMRSPRIFFTMGPGSKSPWSKAWSATSDTSRYSGLGQWMTPHFEYLWTSVFQSSMMTILRASIAIHRRSIHGKAHGKKLWPKFYTRISVGARQLVRNGNYAGQLVEDDGVKSDVIVRSTIDDILPGDKGISAYDRIADYLGDVAQGKWMARPISYLGHMIAAIVLSDSINIPVVASGVDEITVVYQGETWELERRIINSQDGWNFNNGKWTIGDGISDYSGYTTSTVRVWLSAPVGSKVSVSLDADSRYL